MGRKTGGVLNEDCIAAMRGMDAEWVDLAFADPPFNIGYQYDVYHDHRQDDDYLNWCSEWIGQVVRLLKPNGTFWLAIGGEYSRAIQQRLAAIQPGDRLDGAPELLVSAPSTSDGKAN